MEWCQSEDREKVRVVGSMSLYIIQTQEDGIE